MQDGDDIFIGQETSLRKVFDSLRRVAPKDVTVLVTGESGTGKERIVRCLHALSRRKDHPFVAVNSGSIPRDLLESELFGHERGAFTGALNTYIGRFERANSGTLFLDEIGDMDPVLQVKILRAIQEKTIERVGGSAERKVDVRLVAATHRDLEQMVQEGLFREDLFYRLNVVTIHLPPLRERGEDILRLAEALMEEFCREDGSPGKTYSSEVRDFLLAYPWPGNIRELQNCVVNMGISAEGPVVTMEDVPERMREKMAAHQAGKDGEQKPDGPQVPAGAPPRAAGEGLVLPGLAELTASGLNLKDFLEKIETGLIAQALAEKRYVHADAAARLGIKRTTLLEKLKRRGMLGSS